MHPKNVNGQDNSGVRLPPPLYFVAMFVLGVVLGRLAPLPALPRPWRLLLGGPLLLGGAALNVLAFRRMVQAKTSPSVWDPTTAIVTDGPYRFTRNPIYLGFTLVYLGVSALAGKLWPPLLLPAALAALRQQVVRKEEAYLEAKFGEEYRAYKRRVRRWL